MKNLLFLIYFCACISLCSCLNNNYGEIQGPQYVTAQVWNHYEYVGNTPSGPLRWVVTEGAKRSEYDGKMMSHVFDKDSEEAEIELYVLDRSGNQKGNSFQLEVEVNPFKITVAPQYSRITVEPGQTRYSADKLIGATVEVFDDLNCALSEDNNGCLVERKITNIDGRAELDSIVTDREYAIIVSDANNFGTNLHPQLAAETILYKFSSTESLSAQTSIEVYYTYALFLSSADKFVLSGARDNAGTSLMDQIPSCQKDNFLSFNNDLTWNLMEGNELCDTAFTASGNFVNNTIEFSEQPEVELFNTSFSTAIRQLVRLHIINENELELSILENGKSGLRVYTFTRKSD